MTAVLIVGTGSRFTTVVDGLKEVTQARAGHGMPDLLCVLDEQSYCLFGVDWERPSQGGLVCRRWREKCDTPGDTLARFFYWLVHKMLLNRVAEQPIFHNQEITAVWPSVMAPVIPRMHVDVSED